MKSPLLHELLSKGTKWKWTPQHKIEFQKLKSELQNALTLHPFDRKTDIVITTDGSPKGVGAVLFNKVKERYTTDCTMCLSHTFFCRKGIFTACARSSRGYFCFTQIS